MSGDIYGFDHDRAMVLKAVADTPRLVNQLHLKRRGTSGGSGGGGAQIAWPPAGGIPPAVLDLEASPVTLTPGEGSCTLGVWDGEKWEQGEETVTVYNTVTRRVAGNDYPIQIKKTIDGIWIVDVEDCEGGV
jgi:hypothetical protein